MAWNVKRQPQLKSNVKNFQQGKIRCTFLHIKKKIHQQVLVSSSDIFKMTPVATLGTRYRKLSCKELAETENEHIFSRNLRAFLYATSNQRIARTV